MDNDQNCKVMAASVTPRPVFTGASVDALRGAIMMLMPIDHIRDYVPEAPSSSCRLT